MNNNQNNMNNLNNANNANSTNSTNNMNNILNSKLVELLSTIDKSKIEQVSKMVQNMSSEDLTNLVGMLSKNTNSKNK